MVVSNMKKKKHNGFTALLLSAACEWLLIILLFADALFSHLITKFARFCELQTPCPICTRLDHILRKNKRDHYWSLVCTKHKEEISSLDLKKPPEPIPAPLFGFSKPNAKPPLSCGPDRARFSRRKILVDKFARKTTQRRKSIDTLSDVGCSKTKVSSDSDSEFPFSDDNDGYASCSGTNYIRPTINDFVFGIRKNVVLDEEQKHHGSEIESQPELSPAVGFGPSKPNAKPPLSHGPIRARCSRRKILIDNFSRKTTHRRKSIDTLSDVGCSKTKASSDSELEFPFSDDSDGYASCCGSNYSISTVNDFVFGPRKIVVSDKEQTHNGSEIESQSEVSPAVVFGPAKTNAKPPLSHGPVRARCNRRKILTDNFSRKTTHRRKSIDALSDVGCSKTKISSGSESEFPFSEDDGYASCGGSNYIIPTTNDFVFTLRKNVALDKKQTHNGYEMESQSELSPAAVFGTSKSNAKPPLSRSQVRARISRRKILIDKFARKKTHRRKSIDTLSEVGYSKTKISSDSDSEFPFSDDDDGYASCSGSNYILPTIHDIVYGIRKNMGLDREQMMPHGSEIESQPDLETLSNKSINNVGTEQEKGTRSTSQNRNDSSYISLDEILNVGDIEGESQVDRLKRQVEHDRNCMNCIYRELEEERNAASIAANETMAMITRLQEEKAELRMESLQYLRMMEEQSEYDMDALRRANDLLVEKEKDLQDLEYEFECYRNSVENRRALEDSSD